MSQNAYFGECWNPHVATSHDKAPTPVGEPCSHCDEAIVEGDQGFLMPHVESMVSAEQAVVKMRPTHLDCFLRQIYGSVGHQLQMCSCYGGTTEDPPGMTKREAARAAVQVYERKIRPRLEKEASGE